jgi:hypothetical protein
VAKAAVCKTVIHRFESGCRLHQNDQGVAIQWVATPFLSRFTVTGSRRGQAYQVPSHLILLLSEWRRSAERNLENGKFDNVVQCVLA